MAGFGLYGDLYEFLAKTGSLYMSGPSDTINAAGLLNYNACGYFIRGGSLSMQLQGGQSIKDFILLDSQEGLDNAFINPGTTMAPTILQSNTQWEVPWRLHRSWYSWNKSEMDLHGIGTMSWQDGYQKFKDILTDRKRLCETNWWGTWEAAFFAQPHNALMETKNATNGGKPYSVICTLNEHTSGLVTSGVDAGGTAWTSKQGIASTTTGFSNYDNYRTTYSTLDTAVTNLVSALDRTASNIRFTPPPMAEAKYFQGYGNYTRAIFTQTVGVDAARNNYRAMNDRWENVWDPFGNPMYGGHVFVPVKTLDTVTAFPTGAAAAASTYNDTAGTTNAGPRFFCINTESFRAVFHNTVFKQMYPLQDGGVLQPDTYVQYYDTMGNLVNRNPRLNGIIYPAADITGFI